MEQKTRNIGLALFAIGVLAAATFSYVVVAAPIGILHYLEAVPGKIFLGLLSSTIVAFAGLLLFLHFHPPPAKRFIVSLVTGLFLLAVGSHYFPSKVSYIASATDATLKAEFKHGTSGDVFIALVLGSFLLACLYVLVEVAERLGLDL